MIHAWRRASAAGGAAFLHTSSCEQVLQVWRRVLLRAAGRAVAGRRRGDRAERGRLAGGAAQVAVRRLRLAGALKRAGEMTRDCVRVPESTRDSVRWRSQTGRVISGHLGSSRVTSGHLGSPRVISGHLGSPRVISGNLWSSRVISCHLGQSRHQVRLPAAHRGPRGSTRVGCRRTPHARRVLCVARLLL